jgi:ribosomal-protein-alanine N-acetyltransferase
VKFLQCIAATTEHLTAIGHLDQVCFGGLWTQDAYEREIASSSSDLLVLLAPGSSSHGSPPVIGIGCTWAILEEAHITLLAIDPACRRRGLGQWLLYHLLVRAQQRQLEWATLEVRPSNQGAIRLYEKFGFKVAGRRRRYYSDGEDALILWSNQLPHQDFSRVVVQPDLLSHLPHLPLTALLETCPVGAPASHPIHVKTCHPSSP